MHSESKRLSLVAAAALLVVSAVWGSTFFIIKDLVSIIPPLDFLGVRFFLAGAIIAIFRIGPLLRVNWRVWRRGMILGLFYGLAQVCQTIGLGYTHASVSGFISATYVVLTPVVLFALFRTRIPPITWLAVFLATVALGVLSLQGLSAGTGEGITFIGALFYALHIALMGYWAPKGNQVELGTIQLITLGIFCTICASGGGIVLPSGGKQWCQMLYMVIFAALLAIVTQTWAQSHISATATALILTTEPFFAAAFAIAFGGERFTFRLALGGALMIIAMVVSEIGPKCSYSWNKWRNSKAAAKQSV